LILANSNSDLVEIITFGRYALASCDSALNVRGGGPSITNPNGLKKYLKEYPHGRRILVKVERKGGTMIEKEIRYRALLHPSFASCHASLR